MRKLAEESQKSKKADFDSFLSQKCSWFRFPVCWCILRKKPSYIYEIDTEEDDAD